MNRARLAGALFQGIVLGVLLFLALMRLMSSAHGIRVFRYEGF